MDFRFKPMSQNEALEMKTWQYQDDLFDSLWVEPYLKTSKGPNGCDGFAVYLQDELVGIFEYYDTDSIMSIGLALKPSMVGKGIGGIFLKQGIEFGLKKYDYQESKIILTVDKKNTRAISVYKKFGFMTSKELKSEYEMVYFIK